MESTCVERALRGRSMTGPTGLRGMPNPVIHVTSLHFLDDRVLPQVVAFVTPKAVP